MKISVCIATHRRPERLAALLEDLARQSEPLHEVVVVDNDAAGSAREVVESRRALFACRVRYDIQPVKNISVTRNRTVELATGDWLAFVDDDERAPANWLRDLAEAARKYAADGVLGPVEPVVPEDAPAWIRRGRFYDWSHQATGSAVPLNKLRFGNVLLRARAVRAQQGPFDPALGLTGGEDGDLLARMALGGSYLLWCDEARVYEPIDVTRLSLGWLLRRALRGGQDFARHRLAGRYGSAGPAARVTLFMRALLQAIVAAVLALVCLPLGRHYSARWLTRVTANLGKLSVFWGAHYREYA